MPEEEPMDFALQPHTAAGQRFVTLAEQHASGFLRPDHARGLLRRRVPPAQVAAELWLTDQNSLTRRFKAVFGVTPGQYAGAL